MRHLLSRLRLRYGFRWQRSLTLEELRALADRWLRTIAAILCLLLAYGIVGRMDYEDQTGLAKQPRYEGRK